MTSWASAQPLTQSLILGLLGQWETASASTVVVVLHGTPPQAVHSSVAQAGPPALVQVGEVVEGAAGRQLHLLWGEGEWHAAYRFDQYIQMGQALVRRFSVQWVLSCPLRQ